MLDINLPTIETGKFDFRPVSEQVRRIPPRTESVGLLEWAVNYRKRLGPSRYFDFSNHLYLKGMYEDDSREKVIMKASQMGASEWLVSYALHACDQRSANVLYVFPTEGHVSDFSTARLGPAIEASEYLSSIVVDGSGGGGMRGSDRITLKRIRDRFLYFRGSKVQTDGKAPQLKSIDADVLILDEVDELDPRAVPIARKRLGHAPAHLGNVLQVSTPTYPGVGIHAEWNLSDQRIWHIKCEHCNHWQPLDIHMVVFDWDSLGRPVNWRGKEEGDAWLGCVECGKRLDRHAPGEWVRTYLDRPVAGFHLSKLFSFQMDLNEVVYNLITSDETRRREAFNQDLGLPYSPRGGSLSAEDLDNCRRDYGHGPDKFVTCYMGVDVGRVLHVVIRSFANPATGETKQLYAGETDWEGLDRLVAIYRPRTVVIDALPETTKAREFQNKYPRNMVWIAYYPNTPQGTKKEQLAVWNVLDRKVMIDRTRALDSTLAGFYSGFTTLPHHARGIQDYYDHLRATIRVLKEDSSGQDIAKYIDTGPDHYAHAENYAMIASTCRIGTGWTEGPAYSG